MPNMSLTPEIVEKETKISKAHKNLLKAEKLLSSRKVELDAARKLYNSIISEMVAAGVDSESACFFAIEASNILHYASDVCTMNIMHTSAKKSYYRTFYRAYL